jgi:hypothetical protein
MKKLIYLLLIPIFFNSCEKYEEPTLLTLDGEYIIDKITYSKIDNTPSSNDSVYLPGTIYINPLESFPMDSIRLGFTKWHFDYSVISMSPLLTSTGQSIWTKQYFYNVINHYSNYDLGYIDFNCEGSRRVFKIVDDQIESLTLRSTGAWGYAEIGPDVSLTLHLTRVGP